MVQRPLLAVLLCVLIGTAATATAAAPPAAPPSGQVAPAATVSGVLELDSLHVAFGDVLVFSGETTVRARGDIVIDGTLLGGALTGDPSGNEPATLHLESDGRIVVSGTVRAGSGRPGSLSPAALAVIEDAAWSDPSVAVRWFGSELTEEQARSLLETALTAERLVRLGLEDVGQVFAGGAGGSIVLNAPLILIDGQVIGGAGGVGGPGGRGGAGGRVLVHGACLTRESDDTPRILGGNGGRGGRPVIATARGADGRGGNGGDALCLGSGFDPELLALLIEAQPPGSSTGLRGVGARGGDGGPGADGVHVGVLPSGMVRQGGVDTPGGCAARHGGNGSNGGQGGMAIGGDGGPGGAGRSGCPGEPGRNGGKGGPGGKGTGGQGGQGGNGGLGAFTDCPVQCCGKGGHGGVGGPGGSGTGGRKGLGGNGGAGCGPGLAGEAGRRGAGVAGIGGIGGIGGGGGAGPGNNGANGNNGAQADGGDPTGLSADGIPCPKCP